MVLLHTLRRHHCHVTSCLIWCYSLVLFLYFDHYNAWLFSSDKFHPFLSSKFVVLYVHAQYFVQCVTHDVVAFFFLYLHLHSNSWKVTKTLDITLLLWHYISTDMKRRVDQYTIKHSRWMRSCINKLTLSLCQSHGKFDPGKNWISEAENLTGSQSLYDD